MRFIHLHLGLGDALLCNAIIRKEAKEHCDVLIPAWHHNRKSVEFMFRDLSNVQVYVVRSDDEAKQISGNHDSLKLGFAGEGFNAAIFDQEFYRQAGVPFEERWNGFKSCRNPDLEAKCNVPFRFVHDDWGRGFQITRIKEDDACPIVRPHALPNLFQFCWMLENAEEIHCINSSFLILADSIPTPAAKRLVFHWYARKTDHPRLKKEWEILE